MLANRFKPKSKLAGSSQQFVSKIIHDLQPLMEQGAVFPSHHWKANLILSRAHLNLHKVKAQCREIIELHHVTNEVKIILIQIEGTIIAIQDCLIKKQAWTSLLEVLITNINDLKLNF